MLLIETNIGNYGRYKDLYLDMLNRGIRKVTYKMYYVFDLVSQGTMSIDDVRDVYENVCREVMV